jgi:hypothetical protein
MNWLKNDLDYYENRWMYRFVDEAGKVIIEGEVKAAPDNSRTHQAILKKHPELGGSLPAEGFISRIPKSFPRRLVIWLFKQMKTAVK